jgi:hypothetical protein
MYIYICVCEQQSSQMEVDSADEADTWGDDGDDGGWGDDDGDAGWGDQTDYKVTDVELESNNTDESWKIRLSAVSALQMFAQQRSDLVTPCFDAVMGGLICRFAERDMNVKELILATTAQLLLDTVSGNSNESDAPEGAMDVVRSSPSPMFTRQRSTFDLMGDHVDSIVAASEKELKAEAETDSVRARTAIFKVLCALVQVREGVLAHMLTIVLPHVQDALAEQQGPPSEDTQALQKATLTFLVAYLTSHSFGSFKGVKANEKAFGELLKCVLLYAKTAPQSTVAVTLMVLRTIAAKLKESPTFKRTGKYIYVQCVCVCVCVWFCYYSHSPYYTTLHYTTFHPTPLHQ